jgi:hypothetical protein
VGNAQRRILNTLLDNQRLQRMIEAEGLARDRAAVYTAGELLADLRRGVWSETARGGTIDPYRRRLQLNYLEVIGGKINGGGGLSFANLPGIPAGLFPSLGSASDARALLRGELADLDRELAGAAPRVTDRTTRLHLQGARDQIQKILFPEGGGRR